MAHSIDFDSIDARLLTLHQVTLGSRAFCERFQIDRAATEIHEYEWWEYFGHLKALASSTLIDAAIKIRMLQDFVRQEDRNVDVKELQANAIAGLSIGVLLPGAVPLSLRDSCNKIIHATGAKLVWREATGSLGKYEYWSGTYHVFGTEHSGTAWEAAIDVPDWCTAMLRFNKAFQMSVDWSRVQKWDQ